MASLNASASSSSSNPTGGWTYDVFLSFRGEDTRNNFVDHLYAALVQKGIHAFKDDQMVRRGKPISPELVTAIEESRFALVVFSENYANSSWCLEELGKIMECQDRRGLKVLPVFYHVDPSDVRKQKGSFATAFQEHRLDFNGEKNEVNKWREALAAAASLSGYHISAVSGGEYTTIIKIVQDILGDMQPRVRENNLKWAATNGSLSVGIPGSRIPSWFTNQHDGYKLALKLPFKWQTQIIGFAICGVFRWIGPWNFPSIKFRFENGQRFDPMMEVDCINASVDNENENVWIAYVPFSLLESMHHNHGDDDDDDDCQCEDWSYVIEGNLIIELTSTVYGKAVRCGAQVVYKEDIESTQHIKPSISSSCYWKWTLSHGSQNTIRCW